MSHSCVDPRLRGLTHFFVVFAQATTPVPATRRTNSGGGRPERRVLHVREEPEEGDRRARFRRRMAQGMLRLGVQGPPRRPRQSLRPASAIPRVAGQPAAAGRLRLRPIRNPHQLQQHHQAGVQLLQLRHSFRQARGRHVTDPYSDSQSAV